MPSGATFHLPLEQLCWCKSRQTQLWQLFFQPGVGKRALQYDSIMTMHTAEMFSHKKSMQMRHESAPQLETNIAIPCARHLDTTCCKNLSTDAGFGLRVWCCCVLFNVSVLFYSIYRIMRIRGLPIIFIFNQYQLDNRIKKRIREFRHQEKSFTQKYIESGHTLSTSLHWISSH